MLKFENINGRTVINPSKGMCYTDGKKNHGRMGFLAEGSNPDDYREIPVEEYEAIIREEEAKNEKG